jgi:dCMP deaminase
MAKLVAQRATCFRRRVGCVLVNGQYHVMATGYNGVASGVRHCSDFPCPGAHLPSGEGLHLCQAIHAEQNALIQCHDISLIDTVYCTASPCISCVRLLLNTSARRIVFIEHYPHYDAAKLWLSMNRQWQWKNKLMQESDLDNER